MPPSRARSVLASVLLGTDPPWLPTPLLVRTGALFGITEGTVRTALSRMAAAGEVGRRGTAATRWPAASSSDSDARPPAARRRRCAWDGTWELATIER